MAPLVAHQADVTGVVEELVDIAQVPASRAQDAAVYRPVYVTYEVQQHHGEKKPRRPSGQSALADSPCEYP